MDEQKQDVKKDLPTKENLYDKIPLTTKQLDIILIVLGIAFVVFFVLGALKGNGII